MKGVTVLLAASVIALTTIGCGHERALLKPAVAPASLAGCYTLSVGQWSGPKESSEPPTRIVLLDSTGTADGEAGMNLVRLDPITAPMPFPVAIWRRFDANHLQIAFAMEFSGITLELVWGWGDGTWGGTATAWNDGPPGLEAVATARLHPRDCG